MSSLPSDRILADGLWRRIAAHRLPHDRRQVAVDERLARAGQPLTETFVPLDAIVLVARQTELDPVPLTVGLIGREGLVGWPLLLDTRSWRHDAVVLASGSLVAIRAADLERACAVDPDLHRLLLRVAHNHTMQLAQSVVANLGHSVERRLARWLIMLDDRTAGDVIAITHDQLAQLLNVRRATVTDALHVLEGEHLVRSTRGKLTVRDRPGLETRARQSYGFAEFDYQDAVGPFGKGSTNQEPEQEPARQRARG